MSLSCAGSVPNLGRIAAGPEQPRPIVVVRRSYCRSDDRSFMQTGLVCGGASDVVDQWGNA